jgi:hypothetical protein
LAKPYEFHKPELKLIFFLGYYQFVCGGCSLAKPEQPALHGFPLAFGNRFQLGLWVCRIKVA